MISVGNDIISLKSVDAARTKQAQFYTKFLTSEEVDLYDEKFTAILPFEHFAWLLWSVKESVYKCHKRNNTQLIFSPKKITIPQVELPKAQPVVAFASSQLEQNATDDTQLVTCKATFGEYSFYSQSIIFRELIYTIASNTSDFSCLNWGLATIEDDNYESQYTSVRSLLLTRLQKSFFNRALQIVKDDAGIPILMIDDQLANVPFSLSHHDNYVGYCFLLTEHAQNNEHITN